MFSYGSNEHHILSEQKPVTVPKKPRRVKVQATNSTTIYVEWRPPRDQADNGLIKGYYVFFTIVDNNGEPETTNEEVRDTGDGRTLDMVITGLRPGTRYQVAVAAHTRKGHGALSRPKIISTKEPSGSETVTGNTLFIYITTRLL